MRQRAEHGLKERIAAAEVALWDLLREASDEELDKVPELEGLLEVLAQ